MTVYVYCRVSTGKQEQNGHSLKSQARLCLELARSLPDKLGTATNCDEPGVFCDASSAFKTPLGQRAGGKLMLSLLAPGDTIVMYDIIRGWRSTIDFASNINSWIATGISLRFVAYPSLDLGTANGRLTASVIAAYGEWKSAITSERMREYRAAREKGLIDRPERTQGLIWSSSVEMQAISEVLRPARAVQAESNEGSRVIGYVRVSTDDQSVESQIGPIESYIESLPYESAGIVEDQGVSALKVNFADRPGARQLLEWIQRGDHLVVLRPARAFRTVRDMIHTIDMLHEMGVTVHIAEGSMKSGDPNFQLCMQIMTLMAQIESEENSRRVKDANEWMWENGFVPRGSASLPRWVKTVQISEKYRHCIPDEDYIEDCRYVRERREQKVSYPKICIELDKIVAERECRFPVSPGGAEPTVALNRYRTRCDRTPFHQIRQRPFVERIEKAMDLGRFVLPFYTIQNVKQMSGHLDSYQRYIEILNRNGVEKVAEAIR